jgi:hypothetical protein
VPFTILTFGGAPSTKTETPFINICIHIWRFRNAKWYGFFF